MGNHQQHDGLEPAISQLIMSKAKRMTHQPEFREDSREDLEQELTLRWLEAESGFDHARGNLITYANTVLDNHIRNLLETRNALRRAWYLCQASLDDPVHDEDEPGLTLHEVYDQDTYFGAIGSQDRDPVEVDDLRCRLDAELRKLPSRVREFAIRLASQSLTEIARDMRLNRSTLYDWKARVRRAFRDAGLEEYLRD